MMTTMIGLYRLDIDCAYCNERNKNVIYSPFDENVICFCYRCGNPNFITFEYKSKRIEEVCEEDIKDSLLMEAMCVDEATILTITNSLMRRLERLKEKNMKLNSYH